MASKHSLIQYEIDLRKSSPKKSAHKGILLEPSASFSSLHKSTGKNLSPLLRPPSTNGKSPLDRAVSPHPWDMQSKMIKAKSVAKASTQQLSHAIQRLDSSDSRPTSANPFPPFADHIDRKLRAISPPGSPDSRDLHGRKRPLVTIQAQDSFYRANRSVIKDIERLRQNINQPVHHTQTWDSRFVYEGSLSQPVRVQSASIHRKHDKFVSAMKKFKHSQTLTSSSLPSSQGMLHSISAPLISIAISRSSSPVASRPVSPEKLNVTDLVSNVHHEEANEILFWDEHQPVASPNHPSNVLQASPSSTTKEFSEDEVREMLEAECVWDSLCDRLKKLGANILYTDLFEISILRQPHASIIALVGFVGILMGLKPTWKTVKGILLKEFSIFLNFVREVLCISLLSRSAIFINRSFFVYYSF